MSFLLINPFDLLNDMSVISPCCRACLVLNHPQFQGCITRIYDFAFIFSDIIIKTANRGFDKKIPALMNLIMAKWWVMAYEDGFIFYAIVILCIAIIVVTHYTNIKRWTYSQSILLVKKKVVWLWNVALTGSRRMSSQHSRAARHYGNDVDYSGRS